MKIFILGLMLVVSSCAQIRSLTNNNSGPDKYDKLKYEENDTTIVQEVFDPEYTKKFEEEICKNMTRDACITKLGGNFYARLRERYYLADTDKITSLCDAHPIECNKVTTLEHLYVISHNAGVEKQRSLDNIESDQRTRSAASAFFQGMSDNSTKTTNCHTDNFSNTRCTSN